MISGWVAPPPPLLPPLLRCSQPIISPSPAQTASPRCSCSAVPDVSASSCYSLGFVFVFFSSLCLWGETRAPLFLFFLRIVLPGLDGGNACIYSQINFCAKRRHLQMGQCVYVHGDVGARLCALIGRPPLAFSSSVLLTATKRLQVV